MRGWGEERSRNGRAAFSVQAHRVWSLLFFRIEDSSNFANPPPHPPRVSDCDYDSLQRLYSCTHMLRSGRRLSYTSAYKHLEQNTPGRAQASHLRAGISPASWQLPVGPSPSCHNLLLRKREASEADVSTAIYFFASMIFGCALRYSRCSCACAGRGAGR